MAVVDHFSKTTHFIPSNTTNDVVQTVSLYFKEVVSLHGVLRTVLSDRDSKFATHFWLKSWKKMGIKLKIAHQVILKSTLK